jgi:hypothetical protein
MPHRPSSRYSWTRKAATTASDAIATAAASQTLIRGALTTFCGGAGATEIADLRVVDVVDVGVELVVVVT